MTTSRHRLSSGASAWLWACRAAGEQFRISSAKPRVDLPLVLVTAKFGRAADEESSVEDDTNDAINWFF